MVKLRFLVPLLGMMMLDLGPMEVGYAVSHKNKGSVKQVKKSNVRTGRNSQGSSNVGSAARASTPTSTPTSAPAAPGSISTPAAPGSTSTPAAVAAGTPATTTSSSQSMTRAPYAPAQSMMEASSVSAAPGSTSTPAAAASTSATTVPLAAPAAASAPTPFMMGAPSAPTPTSSTQPMMEAPSVSAAPGSGSAAPLLLGTCTQYPNQYPNQVPWTTAQPMIGAPSQYPNIPIPQYPGALAPGFGSAAPLLLLGTCTQYSNQYPAQFVACTPYTTQAPYAGHPMIRSSSVSVARANAFKIDSFVTGVLNSAHEAFLRAQNSPGVQQKIIAIFKEKNEEIDPEEAARWCNMVTEAEFVEMKAEFGLVAKLCYSSKNYAAVAQSITTDPAIVTIAATVADRAAIVADTFVRVRDWVRGCDNARYYAQAALADVKKVVATNTEAAAEFSKDVCDRAAAATSLADAMRNAAESAAAAAADIKAAIESDHGSAAVTEATRRLVPGNDNGPNSVRDIAAIVAEVANIIATAADKAAAAANDARMAANTATSAVSDAIVLATATAVYNALPSSSRQ